MTKIDNFHKRFDEIQYDFKKGCDGCNNQVNQLWHRLCGHKLCHKCNEQRECLACTDIFNGDK